MGRKSNPFPSGGLQDFQTAENCVSGKGFTISTPVLWHSDGKVAETEIPVDGSVKGLRIRMHIASLKPHEPKLTYLHPDGFIRRLCVNIEHRPFSGTHKHSIVAQGENAYEPTDIPEPPMDSTVQPQVYREILEAFIAECLITCTSGYKWSSPPMRGGSS